MAAKTQITNKGLELLASSSKATGQHWWIGWYALAFVPDELQEEDGEKLSPSMTKLTENGDIIYNIFQGDMNGDGYQTTKASSKFKSVNYDSNIKKNYRYVLDEDGKNNLVTFVDGTKGLKGAYVYPGVEVNTSRDNNGIGYTKSRIPLPAPLLYTGVKAAGEGWSINGMNIFLGSGNDSIDKFYPVEEVDGVAVPRVSTDFRNYEGYKNGLPKPESGNKYEDGLDEFNSDPSNPNKVDSDGWTPSVYTYTQNDETDMGEDYNQYCLEYWKVLSISNFNKYCAPVNASGLLYDENTGCRNMAKATKYFPISDYSVTSTAKTADNEYATGIKLKVQLKLNGNAEDDAYFKDVEGDADNVASLIPSPSEEEQKLFNSQMVSFKFNRIGIYAVPMRQYGCSGDSAEMKAQYQIDTEAEPVLFAVCEWDSPVTLSDSGEGLSEFQSDIFVDLSAAVDDSSVIRESAVFYNLYEDDAIDWYKNQLVANAAMGEAIINMQIEMGYIRDQKNAKGCCPKQEEIKQNNKVSTGLRNLVDAEDYESNSVRNRLAQEEGKKIDVSYSDIIGNVGGIGHPSKQNWHIHARKTTVGQDDLYSAYVSPSFGPPGKLISTSEAVIDGNHYLDMTPSDFTYDQEKAVRIGGLWLRTELYYELYSFIQPISSDTNSVAYDYPDDAETNDFINNTQSVTDYFGSGTIVTGYPYVIITKTADGVQTNDAGVVTQGIPNELNSITEFVNELNRSLENYETKREYTAYYIQYTSSRLYTGFAFKRTTSMKLPKVQLYRIDQLSTVSQRLSSTGWRIPTYDEWTAICSKITKDDVLSIRSSGSYWKQSGGTGNVYPLGAALTGRTGKSLYYDPDAPAIYLAIADRTDKVVKFDGDTFEIISTPSIPEYGFSYVAVLCVADAVKVADAIPSYKLGYDSYALMEGSLSAGNHNFNAGEKSSIFASAHYNSIFGGMYNKISESSHNTILNGYKNELVGAVFSTVCGDNNKLQKNTATPVCRTLLTAYNSVITGGATSSIFVEESNITSAYQASIMGDSIDVSSIYVSRFFAQNTDTSRGIYFSDVIADNAHNLPFMTKSRANVSYDSMGSLPALMVHDTSVNMHHSDLMGNNVYFWKKTYTNPSTGATEIDTNTSNINYGTIVANAIGISNMRTTYSDIYANGGIQDSPMSFKNTWCEHKTIDSVEISFSSVKLYDSSIVSNYVSSAVNQSVVNFSDLSLSYSMLQLSAKNGDIVTTHRYNFGVMKVSESCIALCDCSYIYETGTKHYLSSSTIEFATLVGKTVALTSGTFRNFHLYGSLSLSSSTINNHIILGGLEGTTIGSSGTDASAYISEFGSYIASNYHNYPMIWSLGGVGMYMNKMILGNCGVSGASEPHIGDVLTVVGVEGNLATVAWMPGGTNGKFGTINLEVTFKCANTGWAQGAGGEYAMNLWALRDTSRADCVVLNGENIPNSGNVVETMNGRLGNSDIKFKVENGLLVLENTGSDTYTISGSAACVEVSRTNVDEPTSSSYGWNMWDTDDFIPMPLGHYSAALNTNSNVGANGTYDDMLRYLILGFKTSDDAQGAGELCGVTLAEDQELVCKYSVNINYRKS